MVTPRNRLRASSRPENGGIAPHFDLPVKPGRGFGPGLFAAMSVTGNAPAFQAGDLGSSPCGRSKSNSRGRRAAPERRADTGAWPAPGRVCPLCSSSFHLPRVDAKDGAARPIS